MNKFLYVWVCALLLIPSSLTGQEDQQKTWPTFIKAFAEEYANLSISGLSLSYEMNLDQIPTEEVLSKQEDFFTRIKKELDSFDLIHSSEIHQLEQKLLRYQVALHQERIQLAKQWHQINPKEISKTGLAHIPLGKEWYIHFLHQWVDLNVDPDSLFQFGKEQVARAKHAMREIQKASGLHEETFQRHLNEDSFFYHSPEEAEAAFIEYQNDVSPILQANFPYLEKVPAIEIKRGTDPNLAKVPGFYRNNTFFYNYFEKPFNKRQIGWLYLHEALPGHHYERSLRSSLGQTDLQNLFWMPCYSEGWAAYIEEIAIPINAYRDLYEEYGKWEWDLIRSVRVMLDVGLNYYQWDDAKAMEVWRKHIHHLDDIGEREIARMKRWPAQVITYKYGADWFLRQSQNQQNLMAYHQSLMELGPLPFSVLHELIEQ